VPFARWPSFDIGREVELVESIRVKGVNIDLDRFRGREVSAKIEVRGIGRAKIGVGRYSVIQEHFETCHGCSRRGNRAWERCAVSHLLLHHELAVRWRQPSFSLLLPCCNM
jgi:hypothetical protein